MKDEEILRMTGRDLKRLHAVRQNMGNQTDQKEGSGLLGVSVRQFRRLAKRVREEGDIGIVRRSRGRASNRRISEKTRKKALRVYERKYSGFGPTFASEKLRKLDRLVKEMRLRKIKTQEAANVFLEEYLPDHNRRFSVAARQSGDAHRPSPGVRELDAILCVKSERRLSADWTVAYKGKTYQIEDRAATKRIVVEERLDGTLRLCSKGKPLKHRELAGRPRRVPVASKAPPWNGVILNRNQAHRRRHERKGRGKSQLWKP